MLPFFHKIGTSSWKPPRQVEKRKNAHFEFRWPSVSLSRYVDENCGDEISGRGLMFSPFLYCTYFLWLVGFLWFFLCFSMFFYVLAQILFQFCPQPVLFRHPGSACGSSWRSTSVSGCSCQKAYSKGEFLTGRWGENVGKPGSPEKLSYIIIYLTWFDLFVWKKCGMLFLFVLTRWKTWQLFWCC